MRKKYHVVPDKNGWIIKGSDKPRTYKTKKEAVKVARSSASGRFVTVVTHSKDGNIANVYVPSKRIIQTAKVKHRLNTKKVRNSIAKVVYEHN